MQRFNEDCFYFLTASCAKGTSCPYRHNPWAIQSQTICSAWTKGTCVDVNCSLRHSNVPITTRMAISNAPPCFYETTSTGCLKPDCAFTHIRPRLNLRNPMVSRPSTTNLVNKDPIKNLQSTHTTVAAPTKHIEPVEEVPVIKKEMEKMDITKQETITTEVVKPDIVKTEIPQPEIVKSEVIKQDIEVSKKSDEILPERKENPIRNVLTNGIIDKVQENKKPTNGNGQTRLVVNRSVVMAESNSRSNRTIVLASDRVKVTSDENIKTNQHTNDSDSDLDDLINDENPLPTLGGKLDISFPCSTTTMSGRLFMTSKTSITTSTNSNTKPIRLRRDPLPIENSPNTNSDTTNLPTTNGKKISAGTDLTDEEERRNKRLERFKPKPNSPPSITNNKNERKRHSEKNSQDESRPSKRPVKSSSPNETNSHRRNATIGDLCSPSSSPPRRNRNYHDRRSSPPSYSSPVSVSIPTYSSNSCMSDVVWHQEVARFLAKMVPREKNTPDHVEPLRVKPSKPPTVIAPTSRPPVVITNTTTITTTPVAVAAAPAPAPPSVTATTTTKTIVISSQQPPVTNNNNLPVNEPKVATTVSNAPINEVPDKTNPPKLDTISSMEEDEGHLLELFAPNGQVDDLDFIDDESIEAELLELS